MASCAFCRTTILFGGVTAGPDRYCNQRCYQGAVMAHAADAIPSDLVAQAVLDVHEGSCPSCGGAGPVDMHTSYFVWSAMVLTSWKNTPAVSCRACARKRQLGAALGSAVVGWWGFPWGLVMTPVQVGRNIAALTGGPLPHAPSKDLERAVRMQLGARLLAAEREGDAPRAPPMAPPAR